MASSRRPSTVNGPVNGVARTIVSDTRRRRLAHGVLRGGGGDTGQQQQDKQPGNGTTPIYRAF